MREIASFNIYSELLAPHYEGRYHCVPLDVFGRIVELAKVAEPKNNFTARVEVGSDEFEEIVETLHEQGAVLKDSEKTIDGPTISVGRSIEFSAEDIANAKFLRLALKKEIIELDVHQWREGRYVIDGKGKPSFKFGFGAHTQDFAASSAFLEKMEKQGFTGIQALEIMNGNGEGSGFSLVRSSIPVTATFGGYITDEFKLVASYDEVGVKCLPGNKFSPEILVFPNGTLTSIDGQYLRTHENFGRTADRMPWILIDQAIYQFLVKQKIKMEAYPVLEEEQYHDAVSRRMDEILR